MIFSAQLYTKIDKIKLITTNKGNVSTPTLSDEKAIVITEKLFMNDRNES